MAKCVISMKLMLTGFLVLLLVAGMQFVYSYKDQERTTVWSGNCSYQEWGRDGSDEILMKVRCEDGAIAGIKNSDAFLSVLNGKTNEFQCKREKSGRTSCVPIKNP